MPKNTKNSKKSYNFISSSQRSGIGHKVMRFGSRKLLLAEIAIIIVSLIAGAYIITRDKSSEAAITALSNPGACTVNVNSATMYSIWKTYSPAHLMNTLGGGQVICLTGTFNMGVASVTSNKVTLRSADGTRAKIYGSFNITGKGNRFMNLYVDGKGQNSGTFLLAGANAQNNLIEGNHITSTAPNKSTTDPNIRQGICMNIGQGGKAKSIDGPKYNTINANRIFNCGWGKYDQAIYLSNNQYNLISNNYVYDNPMFGLQFYPDSDYTIVEHNVFYNNSAGITFSGFDTVQYSQTNTFRNNIVANTGSAPYGVGAYAAKKEATINHWWGGTVGSGNLSQGNCLAANPAKPIYKEDGKPKGYTVQSDDIKNLPYFVNAPAKDFRLTPTSNCKGKGPLVAPPF